MNNIEINRVYQCNCLNLLNRIDDSSIDLICIDPPYQIGYMNKYFDDKKNVDYLPLAIEFSRILKNTGNILIFSGWSENITMILEMLNFGSFKVKNSIVWDRQKTKNGGDKNFTSAREDILWFVKSEDYIFNKEDSKIKKKTKGFGCKNGSEYRRLSNVWTDVSPVMYTTKEYNGYPTQKPLELMRRIIRVFSNPDDLVVDCFCGSGSTLEAAKIEGRNYVGCDINDNAIEICNKRLSKYND